MKGGRYQKNLKNNNQVKFIISQVVTDTLEQKIEEDKWIKNRVQGITISKRVVSLGLLKQELRALLPSEYLRQEQSDQVNKTSNKS